MVQFETTCLYLRKTGKTRKVVGTLKTPDSDLEVKFDADPDPKHGLQGESFFHSSQ
jgi:hypothetical protein